MSRGVTQGSSTSSSLIRRVQKHDADAWSRLCNIYGPLVYRWARRAGLTDEDAADVGQEVFRTVASRIDSFQRHSDSGSFRGWLWTIVRNKLGDHFRAAASRPQAAGGTDAHQRLEQTALGYLHPPSEAEDAGSETRLLRRALTLIKQDFETTTWQAFWRATVDGQNTATIAEELNMSQVAVRQAKFRILHRLRSELDQLID